VIAMLGMYDMPALQPANDRFWAAIHNALGHGPTHLTRDRDFWEIWTSPDLIFAQTCGMPYRTRLHDRVQLVGTPDYGLPNCPPGYYYSVFVAREDDSRALKDLAAQGFAYNEALSQSGWAAPITHLSALGLKPARVLETGGHAQSAKAVANGQADLAALDALTWRLLKEHTDLGGRLRVVDVTGASPALPYITSKGQDAPRIAEAVRHAIKALPFQDRQALHIRDLIDIPTADYLAVATPPEPESLLSAT